MAPAVVSAAAAAAATILTPPPTAAATDTHTTPVAAGQMPHMVDVRRLLDLSGIAPSASRDDQTSAENIDHGDDQGGGAATARQGQEEKNGQLRRGESGLGASGSVDGGVGGRRRGPGAAAEAEAGAAAFEVDEDALRRVTHQGDLYSRLLVRREKGCLVRVFVVFCRRPVWVGFVPFLYTFF